MVILLPVDVEVENYFDSLRVEKDFDTNNVDIDLYSYSYPKCDKNYAVYGVKDGSDDILVAISNTLRGAENYASVMAPSAVYL